MILRRVQYRKGWSVKSNEFRCGFCEEMSAFRCARGVFKHMLDHFCSDAPEGERYPKIAECSCCFERLSAGAAVKHFAGCFNLLCDACDQEKDEWIHVYLLNDLTLVGNCECGLRYEEKADWILFEDPEDLDIHPMHYEYLPPRLEEEPSLNEKRKGADQVERNYHELMDCRDAHGVTFDEAIAACLIPDKKGVVNVECDCFYCDVDSGSDESGEGQACQTVQCS